MNYLDIFSGISAPTAAWSILGWKSLAYSEIDPYCSAVLSTHYPDVPNYGNVRLADWSQLAGLADILVGGSPCQSFSVSGSRGSLGDDRGQLTLEYVNVCNQVNPPFAIWENVPGVLRTKDNAFGKFLGRLVGEANPLTAPQKLGKWPNSGFCIGPRRSAAWRVMDALGWGVPQRRKRVFVVAFDLRNISRLLPQVSQKNLTRLAGIPAAVLFEPAHLSGTAAPRFETGSEVAATLRGGSGSRGWHCDDESGLVAFTAQDHGQDAGIVSPTLRSLGSTAARPNGGGQVAIAYNLTFGDSNGLRKDRPNGGCYVNVADAATTLTTSNGSHPTYITEGWTIRRLTPTECLRLQGFPDDYLDIYYKNKLLSNAQKYRLIGNSMAVPVVRWIGERIEAVVSKVKEEF